MTELTCAQLRDLACELALDALCGEERATALAHLEACTDCRHEVASLTAAAEELILLAPAVEVSPVFEQRVVRRVSALADASTERARRRRPAARMRLLAAAAVLVVLGAGIMLATSGARNDADAQVADMHSATGEVVGDATLVDDGSTVVVDVPNWIGLVHSYGATVDAPYWLAVETGDGGRELHRLPPADEQPWVVDIDGEPETVTAVALVDNQGNTWCTARFAQAPA